MISEPTTVSGQRGLQIGFNYSSHYSAFRGGMGQLGRLLHIAAGSTGQSRKVADFLLAWHNAEDNGGWDPVDLWSVDVRIAADILAVLHLIHASHCYAPELGFEPEITAVWELWRGQMALN